MSHTTEQKIGLLQQLGEDLRVNASITRPGFQAVAVHRLGAWRRRLPKPFRLLLFPVYHFLRLFVRNVYGIELHPFAKIGRRLAVAHQSGIVVHQGAVIGDDCLLRQNVTIGVMPGRDGAPRLGDRVWVGAGAVIFGPVAIGDEARIGPNAVVMTNVPAGGSAFAPLARVMPKLNLRKKSPQPAPAPESAKPAPACPAPETELVPCP